MLRITVGPRLSRLVSLVVALAAPLTGTAGAQNGNAKGLTLACSPDPKCLYEVAPPDSLQRAGIVLRVMDGTTPVAGAIVRFRPTSGNVLPDTAVADKEGYARAEWIRGKGADIAGVAAEARSEKSSGTTLLQFTPREAKPADAKKIIVRQNEGFNQSWFEKGQLPSYVEVELRTPGGKKGQGVPITDRAECAANRVHFKPFGAPSTVSPDTATGVVETQKPWYGLLGKKTGCFAWTYWALGEGIGERELVTTLVPRKGYEGEIAERAYAWARATPKFVTGIAASHFNRFVGLNPASKRTVHVEDVDPVTGITRSYDTTETTSAAAIDSVKATTQINAVFGVSVPIPLSFLKDFDGLSLTAAVDLANPTDRLYAGISLLRALGFLNPAFEGLPADLHIVGLWAKQPVLKDPNCAPADCVVEKRSRLQNGVSFIVTADASSLIEALVKKLAP